MSGSRGRFFGWKGRGWRPLALVAVVLLALAGGFALGLAGFDRKTPVPEAGKPPPPLTMPADAGGDRSLAAVPTYEEALPEGTYEGKVIEPGGAHFGGPGPITVVRRPRIPPSERPAPSQTAGEQPLTEKPAEVRTAALLPAWRRNAAPAARHDGRPMIAVVIDDLGIDRPRTKRAIALDSPVTLAFLAYARHLPEQSAAAGAAGHELLVHVGMEPLGTHVDPGPNVLAAGLSRSELERRLAWDLGRFHGYIGINNHMGSKFTADRAGMAVVMDELKRRGLLFLDSLTTAHSVGARLAEEKGVPVIERNVFLDNVDDRTSVRERLAEVERIARRNGYAVAIGHPRDATLDVLATWLGEVGERGFAVVPLSAIVAALSQDGSPR